jgi:hypothetical protein
VGECEFTGERSSFDVEGDAGEAAGVGRPGQSWDEGDREAVLHECGGGGVVSGLEGDVRDEARARAGGGERDAIGVVGVAGDERLGSERVDVDARLVSGASMVRA